MQILLVVWGETGRQRNVRLDKNIFVIGREESCDLILADALVSRRHATIVLTEDEYYIADMGSTNGTKLNDERVDRNPKRLFHGDEILIGNTVINFVDRTLETQTLSDLSHATLERINMGVPHETPAEMLRAQKSKAIQKAFISHSSEDDEFITQLANDLTRKGSISTWVDHQDIQGGSDWDDKVREALNECSHMILVLTPASITSRNVKVEWRFFLDRDKPIFPVMKLDCQLPLLLSFHQVIDFISDYEKGLANLVEALKQMPTVK
jgi:pSer/pThr/pTyr-binding forkhead associated (FHA) protein